MQTVRSVRLIGRRLTALLLAAVVCVGGSASLAHSAWDDPGCNPAPVHHDHNAHRFQSGRLPSAPADDHCILCHSHRLLRAGLIATPVAVSAAVRLGFVPPDWHVLTGRVLDSTAASRAPPLDL
jgi:hypothetical protein